MGGTVNADTWKNSDGTENYKCRAWVNFDGTGTVAIRASGNVSSITDHAAGQYTINFATAMPDADYALIAVSENSATSGTVRSGATLSKDAAYVPTVNSIRLICKNGAASTANSSDIDVPFLYATIFR